MNWHFLGVKLGLEDHELRTIDHDFRGDGNERCKHEMLSRWLRNAKRPTWKAVTDALRLMGEHKVAVKIQTKYCTDAGKLTYSVVLDIFTTSIIFIFTGCGSIISKYCRSFFIHSPLQIRHKHNS